MITKVFGALGVLVGITCIMWSLSVQTVTGAHAATLAVAAFTLSAALGVWLIADRIEEDRKNKQ